MIPAKEVYESYLALKFHFTNPKWSYRKYGMKVGQRAMRSYNEAKVGHTCRQIGSLYGNKYKEFLLANSVAEPGFWIQKAGTHEIYQEWLGRVMGFTYLFNQAMIDLGKLMDQRGFDFSDLIKVEDGEFPFIFRLHLREVLNTETACCLFNGLGLFDQWDEHSWLSNQAMYNAEKNRLRKYSEFWDPGRIFEDQHKIEVANIITRRRG